MEELFEFLSTLVTNERKKKIEKVLSLRTKHFTIVAEDTYQDHNASALVRTCDCFGIQEMRVIQKNNQYNVSKGMSGGAEKWVDTFTYIESEKGIANCLSDLKHAGYQIVAATPDVEGIPIDEFDVSKKSALFFGREREGLSPEILDAAEVKVKIPMVGFTESFNISVAAAIIMSNITVRLRGHQTINWNLSEEEKRQKRFDWYLRSIPNYQRMLHAYLKDHPQLSMKEIKSLTEH